MCVLVCASSLVPCSSWLGVRCGGVCLRLGSSRAPPLLAGLLGRVCVCVRTPLVPRPSRLACAVWACVLGLGFCLCPAHPGWGVGVCVCAFVRVPRFYPVIPGGLMCVCVGVGFVCSLVFSWLGCWGAWPLVVIGRPGQLGQGCRSPAAIAHSRVVDANARVESEQRKK